MANKSTKENTFSNKSVTKEDAEEEELKTERKDEASQTSPILSEESDDSGEEVAQVSLEDKNLVQGGPTNCQKSILTMPSDQKDSHMFL